MNESRPKILYIAGMSRSGSTILGNLLGEINGFFTVGEPVYLSADNNNWKCGCGMRLNDCTIWNAILQDAFGDKQLAVLHMLEETVLRTHFVGNINTISLMLGAKKMMSLTEYSSALARLYHSVQKVTAAKVIIDESKSAPYALALGMNPSLEIWILHLVRDSRAVAYSWMRKKKRNDRDDLFMKQIRAITIARKWMIENLALQSFFGKKNRYQFLRYEDFILSPQKYLEGILSWIGINGVPTPLIGPHTVLIQKEHHLIRSNPAGCFKGLIELKNDDEWLMKMSFLDKSLVTICNWPLLYAYRYPLIRGVFN